MFFIISCFAQKIDIDEITNSGEYIIGIGEEMDFELADKKALADLSSQISLQIEADIVDKLEETNGNVHEYTQRIIKTYSHSILTNTQRVTEPLPSGEYKVYRFIKISEKKNIFKNRENKLIQYVKNGLKNEDLNEIGNALRCYYWALILLKSLPAKDSIKHLVKKEEQLLSGYLPQKIQSILNRINFDVSNQSEGQENYSYHIKSKIEKHEILKLNIKYFDGEDWIESNIKDGQGVILVSKDYIDSMIEKKININIDYRYEHLLGNIPLDEEVKSLMEYIRMPFDDKRTIFLKKKIKDVTDNPENFDFERTSHNYLCEMTKEIINTIKKRNFNDVRHFFSEQGFEQFMKIMNYGNVDLFKGEHSVEFLECGDQIQIRSIPLIIRLTDINRKVIYDNIVLIYENEKIRWVNFTISDEIVQDAVWRGKRKKDLAQRMVGVNFMEYYKTIFCMKDDYRIEEIFADSAVIFVGYIKRKEQNMFSDMIENQIDNERVKYSKQTKKEYIERLKNIVFKNDFVNIQFSGLEIVRNSKDKPIYGIQLNQNYYSTGYSDEGYLLLYVDCANENEPKIFFRFWGPEKIDFGDIRFN